MVNQSFLLKVLNKKSVFILVRFHMKIYRWGTYIKPSMVFHLHHSFILHHFFISLAYCVRAPSLAFLPGIPPELLFEISSCDYSKNAILDSFNNFCQGFHLVYLLRVSLDALRIFCRSFSRKKFRSSFRDLRN